MLTRVTFRTDLTGRRQWALRGLAGALAILVALGLALQCLTLLQPGEVMYGEAIIYDQAGRLGRGEALYQPTDRPPDTVAAYTPLYYLAAGALQRLVPGFTAGRVLSFCAFLASLGLVGLLAARRAGDWRPGILAGLLFGALGLPGIYPWSALYKEDLLGVGLSLAALAILGGARSGGAVAGAAILAAGAILTKQTLVAPTLAGLVWLWPTRRRQALLFGVTACGVVATVSLGYELATGAYFANTVFANVNPASLEALSSSLGLLLLYQAGPLVLAGSYAARRARLPGDRLLSLAWLAAWLPVLGLAKVGSNHNYWLELAALTAVLCGLQLWDWAIGRPGLRLSRWSLSPALLLAIHLVVLAPVVGLTAVVGLGAQSRGLANGPALMAVVERVRAEPRTVLANPLDATALAGRPTRLEPYLYAILAAEGRWDSTPLVGEICGGSIGLLVLDHPIEQPGRMYHGYAHWPEPVMRALRATMRLEQVRGDRYLYVRAGDERGEACPA